MPRPRFNNLASERRHKLLECAANEFAMRGYQGASLNGIIIDAGLSKGVFYYYFDDKADLFSTVADYATESVLGEGPYDVSSLSAEEFWPTLEQWFLELTGKLHDLPWLAGLGKLLYGTPPAEDIQGLVASRFDTARAWLDGLLRHGRELGCVRDDEPLDLLLWMMTGALEGSDRWFVQKWDAMSPAERNELAAVSFRIAKRIVASDIQPASLEQSLETEN